MGGALRPETGPPERMTETPDILLNGPHDAALTLVLAHGAGALMDSLFMDAFAEGIAAGGFRVARFEFPYMAQRRETGKKRPPDRAPVLEATWHKVIDHLGSPANTVIGGKSMGGRIASMIADDAGVAGLVCLGYPFHPPGKPERTRTAHLEELRTPALIVQGERDTLGNRADVAGYTLASTIEMVWLPDGDHSFKPRKASGHTEQENWNCGIERILAFMAALSGA